MAQGEVSVDPLVIENLRRTERTVPSNVRKPGMTLPVLSMAWTDSSGNNRLCEEAVVCASYPRGGSILTTFVPLAEWLSNEKQATMKTASTTYGPYFWSGHNEFHC
jgi:hypothetical protein